MSTEGHTIPIRERIEEESMIKNLYFFKMLVLIRNIIYTHSVKDGSHIQHGGCLDQLWNHIGSNTDSIFES